MISTHKFVSGFSAFSLIGLAIAGCSGLASTPSTAASTGIAREFDGIVNKAFCQQKAPNFVDECVRTRQANIDANGRITCASGFAYTDVCFDRIAEGGFITRECTRVAYCSNTVFPSAIAMTAEEEERSWFTGAAATPPASARARQTMISDDIEHVTVEGIAISHKTSVATARRLRSAMMKGLDRDRGELVALGFSDDDLDNFFARLDPTGASESTFATAARRLNMSTSELQDFVRNVLYTVADSRAEIRERNNESEN